MFDVISIGSITRDIFFDYPDLKKMKINEKNILMVPYGEKMVATRAFYTYGGGAFNTSTAFSKLGLRAAAVASIGQEGTGSLSKKRLENEGVSTRLLNRDRAVHTGLSTFIIGKDSEHTGFLERGANNHLKINNWRALKRTKWFYVSSLTGDSQNLLPDIFRFAKKNRIRVAFNPGSVQLAAGYKGLKDLIESTEVLCLNYQEAESLVFSKIKKTPKNAADLLKELEKMGAKINVVTDGERGSHAILDGQVYFSPSCPSEVVDTTGAGDAFGSTIVFGILKKFDIRYALKIASINASSVVTKMGATEGLLNYNRIRSSKWL